MALYVPLSCPTSHCASVHTASTLHAAGAANEPGHTYTDSPLLRIAVYSAIDGTAAALVLLALAAVAGVDVGATLRLLCGGVAGLAAAAALREYTRLRAEREHYNRERDRERWELKNFPEGAWPLVVTVMYYAPSCAACVSDVSLTSAGCASAHGTGDATASRAHPSPCPVTSGTEHTCSPAPPSRPWTTVCCTATRVQARWRRWWSCTWAAASRSRTHGQVSAATVTAFSRAHPVV
jgi:hypothetical protein